MQTAGTAVAAGELVRHKNTELEGRKASARKLQSIMARKMSTASSKPSTPHTTPTSDPTPATGVTSGCWGVLERVFSRMFGQPVVRDGERVTKAVAELEAKVADLDERASANRSRARELAKEGKKPDALKALRRSKEIEKQRATVQTALSALERQASALESAALSREVSKTLSATSKSVKKKAKKLLEQVDQSVDDANDVNDMSVELNDALAGLEAGPTIDEDELEDELEEMVRGTGHDARNDVVEAREVGEVRLPNAPSHVAHQKRRGRGHPFSSLREEEEQEVEEEVAGGQSPKAQVVQAS